MSFTDAEREQWHADRRAGRSEVDGPVDAPVCGHCGNAFSATDGTVTDDFSICEVCNSD